MKKTKQWSRQMSFFFKVDIFPKLSWVFLPLFFSFRWHVWFLFFKGICSSYTPFHTWLAFCLKRRWGGNHHHTISSFELRELASLQRWPCWFTCFPLLEAEEHQKYFSFQKRKGGGMEPVPAEGSWHKYKIWVKEFMNREQLF